MIRSKYCNAIIAVVTGLAVIAVALMGVFAPSIAQAADGGVTMAYESTLFDTDQIMEINIVIDAEQWATLLDSAINEEYYACDVTVNGITFRNVAIRAKGNTSLSSIANDPTTDRYSFKIEFDHYDESQSCFGLDKLVLNNNYADATNMKEAIVYDMFAYLDADASLYNYAKVSVNGEYWGVYLALEAVEERFLLRNYGAAAGELYKPEGVNGGRGMGSMNASGSTNSATLNYIDDDLDSYETIWDGAVTDSGKKDHKRVVAALKQIAAQDDVASVMDVDNVLRYMAVHTFAVNLDSLSGSMSHNYYLYEQDGRLNLIPWDYNLAWGGFSQGGSDASGTVNFAIDTPFSGNISLDDRSFFAALLENETYLAQYHAYLQQLCDYVTDGTLQAVYNRIRNQIDALVESDPTAFYTYDEYDTAAEELMTVLVRRAESVAGQVDGTIPSTTAGQQADSSALVDASDLNLSVMGTMNMGGGNAPGGQNGTPPTRPENSTASDGTASGSENSGNAPGGQNGTPPTRPENSTASDGTASGSENGGMTPPGGDNGTPPTRPEDSTASDGTTSGSENGGMMPPGGDNGNFPGGNFTKPDNLPSDFTPGANGSASGSTVQWVWIGISLAAAAAGIAIAMCFRRR